MAKFVAAPPSTETARLVSDVDVTTTERAVPPLTAMVNVSDPSKVLAALLKSMFAKLEAEVRTACVLTRSTLTEPVTAPPDKVRTSVAAGAVRPTL